MNPKLKSEHYSNFGGINSKISDYDNGPFEFLDLHNYDFQTPGALTQRWGSTQYVGQTFSAPINSLFEFARLDGTSQVIIGNTGGLWAGATTGNSQGITINGSTQILDTYWMVAASPRTIVEGYHFFTYGGAAILGGTFNYGTAAFDANMFGISIYNTVSTTSTIVDPQQITGRANFVEFQNQLWIATGDSFLRYDGATIYNVGPAPVIPSGPEIFGVAGVTSGPGSTAFTQGTSILGYALGLSFGFQALYGAFVNNRGFEGPAWPIGIAGGGVSGTVLGGSFVAFGVNVNVPQDFGISSINIYSYVSSTFLLTGGTAVRWLAGNAVNEFWNEPYTLLRNEAITNGATYWPIYFGSTYGDFVGGWTSISGNAGIEPPTQYDFQGMTLVINASLAQLSQVVFANYSPQYLEVFQSRLFSAGYSSTPSTVWFSDTDEPEGYQSDFNFEVRSNDGDVVTGLKAYSTRLYLFKSRSFHALYGDNPSNFYLQELSLEYGALNNRSIVVYEDTLLFLDQKGVMIWNGAQLDVLSKKIQPLFDKMNISAAKSEACMIHDKLRNQILVAFPSGVSQVNDTVAVFDYLVGAWTTYTGLSISSLQAMFGRNTTRNVFYGSYSGSVNWFGSSFLQDNGVGYTLYMKSVFLKPLGDSTQEQFRRLYVNSNPGSGTFSFNINFFQDYGSSAVLSTSLVMSQFQQRIDFGISAKSIAFEMANIQSSVSLQLFGFTMESRLQRRV